LGREKRFYALRAAAKCAFDAGRVEEAGTLADELLKLASEFEENWNYGNAVHDGHLVLGRIALKKGDITEANRQLILAGKTPGSPQLNSFGPDMVLARDLLQHNGSDVVLEYFELCGRFWTLGRERLTAWTEVVRQGRVPDFGVNCSCSSRPVS
jgi:hypothetical protein